MQLGAVIEVDIKKHREPFRIEISVDRASARRTLVIGGTLILLAVGGTAIAVPVTFQDGNILSAAQLNENFASVEQRLARLEQSGPPSIDGDVNGIYIARASQILGSHAVGTAFAAFCNQGDTVLSGSCYQELSGPVGYMLNEPVVDGLNGWQCQAFEHSGNSVTIHAVALCLPQ